MSRQEALGVDEFRPEADAGGPVDPLGAVDVQAALPDRAGPASFIVQHDASAVARGVIVVGDGRRDVGERSPREVSGHDTADRVRLRVRRREWRNLGLGICCEAGVGAKQIEDVPWARLAVDHGYRAGCGQDLVDEVGAGGVVPPQDDAACTLSAHQDAQLSPPIRRSNTKRDWRVIWRQRQIYPCRVPSGVSDPRRRVHRARSR